MGKRKHKWLFLFFFTLFSDFWRSARRIIDRESTPWYQLVFASLGRASSPVEFWRTIKRSLHWTRRLLEKYLNRTFLGKQKKKDLLMTRVWNIFRHSSRWSSESDGLLSSLSVGSKNNGSQVSWVQTALFCRLVCWCLISRPSLVPAHPMMSPVG